MTKKESLLKRKMPVVLSQLPNTWNFPDGICPEKESERNRDPKSQNTFHQAHLCAKVHVILWVIVITCRHRSCRHLSETLNNAPSLPNWKNEHTKGMCEQFFRWNQKFDSWVRKITTHIEFCYKVRKKVAQPNQLRFSPVLQIYIELAEKIQQSGLHLVSLLTK